jgi:hypothetical protein
MWQSARQRFCEDFPAEAAQGSVELAELTMRNLRGDRTEIDRADFLMRADMLAAIGKTVLISDYFEFHRLAAYVARYARRRTALVIGANTLTEIFGGAARGGARLAALGQLFQEGLTLYVYPFLDPRTDQLTHADNFDAGDAEQPLYRYLSSQGLIRPIENYARDALSVFSRDVLELIQRGDPSWETLVPSEISALIREHHAFGFRAPSDKSAA